MRWLTAPLRTTRRLVVAAVATVVVVVGLVTVAGQASSPPVLPVTTPQALLAGTVRALAANRPISGRLNAHVDLGLPSLPDEGPAASNSVVSFLASLSGEHLLKLWRSDRGLRIADLQRGSERDVVINRRDAWLWDFGGMTAYHLGPFPVDADGAARGALGLLDPVQLSRQVLAAVTPSTQVSIGQSQWAAGRAAYTLILQPRTADTLVGSIQIALDAVRMVPLGVGIFPRGWADPALSVAFTSVSFDPVPSSTFDFSPPPGAKVVSPGSFEGAGHQPPNGKERMGGDVNDLPVRLLGEGWSAAAALRTSAPSTSRLVLGDLDLRAFLPFSGPLMSIRLVNRDDHGWLLFGAVPQRTLRALEPELP